MGRKKAKTTVVEFKPRIVKTGTSEPETFPPRQTRTYTLIVDSQKNSFRKLGFNDGDKMNIEEIFYFEDGDLIAVVFVNSDGDGKLCVGNGFALNQSVLINTGVEAVVFSRKNILLIGKIANLK